MKMDEITLEFDDKVIDYIVDKAVEYKLGARGLRTICEAIMLDYMFDAPSFKGKKISITLDEARNRVEKLHLRTLNAA